MKFFLPQNYLHFCGNLIWKRFWTDMIKIYTWVERGYKNLEIERNNGKCFGTYGSGQATNR